MVINNLNEKLSKWGLASIKKPKPIEHILNLDYKKIENMELKKIDAILVILGQYQIYLQTQLNMWSIRKRRLKEEYDRKINKIAKNIEGKTLTAKKAEALEKSDELKSLLKEYEEAANSAELLHNIPGAIADLMINFRKVRDSKRDAKESELKAFYNK